jgi:hypothetical protein
MEEDKMSTPNKVLTALANANGYVALALQVGETLIPLAKGAIKEIRSIGQGTETVSYEILLTTDAAELDAIDKLAIDDLTVINAELATHGIPPVPLPAPKPPEPPITQ